MGSLDRTTVTLIADKLVMSQETDMSIFQVINWALEKKNLRKGTQGISMAIVMKRKITSELMTTFFPSILLTAITFATTFFKPFFFEAALSVNLTTMLVMTTIFISKMESLPPTSDIKMIDIWLVLCQMVPFAEVVLLTAMEYHRRDDDHGRDNDMVVDMKVVSTLDEGLEDDETQEKERQISWGSLLKTLGDILKLTKHTGCPKNRVPFRICDNLGTGWQKMAAFRRRQNRHKILVSCGFAIFATNSSFCAYL